MKGICMEEVKKEKVSIEKFEDSSEFISPRLISFGDKETIDLSSESLWNNDKAWKTVQIQLPNGLSLYLRTDVNDDCYERDETSNTHVSVWVGDSKTDRVEHVMHLDQTEVRGEGDREKYRYNTVGFNIVNGRGDDVYKTIICENEYGEGEK